MLLKKLTLTNFRNFEELELVFSPITLLVGNNAQGKSNLLEAIYFLATTKSPRAEKDSQLIKEDQSFCRLSCEVESGGEQTELEIAMQKTESFGNGSNGLEKRVRVNGVPRRVSDYIGHLVVVHFAPDDINLVSGAPSLRRWHIDLTLAQADSTYKNALNQYSAAIISRNRLLKRIKEGLSKVNELEFWTNQLLEHGQMITQKRGEFFQFVNSRDKNLGDFRFVYLENQITSDRAREYLAREIAAAITLIGPHRDDFVFKMEQRNLAYFGSRGEQRMAVLDLKLAELEFINQTSQAVPVLLLDDIFSELDEVHRQYVISIIDRQQTILSAVASEQLPEGLLEKSQVVEVKKGQVKI